MIKLRRFGVVLIASAAVGLFVAASAPLRADAGGSVPFFYADATAADPQIASAVVGQVDAPQPVSITGRSHITLNVNTTASRNVGLQTFSFQAGAGGFVGVNPAPPAPAAGQPAGGTPPGRGTAPGGRAAGQSTAGPSATPSILTSPSQIETVNTSVLDQPGMTLVAPLRPSR